MLAPTMVAIMLMSSGCSGQSAPGAKDAAATEGGYQARDSSILLLPPGERRPAPDISGTTLDGDPWSLADLAGSVVVLNVWASWCAPCRAEAPTLKKVSEDLADQGVVFAGLDTRDSDTSARAFEESFGITYPSVIDRDGQLQLRFAGDIVPNAIPSTVVVDRQGRVAGRVLGRASESTLRALIEPLLAEPSAPPGDDD